MLRENRRRREKGRSEAAATATTAGSVNENAAVTDGKANVLSNADDVVDQTSSAYPDNTTAASPNNTSAAADRTAAATNVSPRTNPSQRRRQKDWILDVKQQQKSKYFLGTSELYR